ncbi:MAG: tetratricopeptide repeat protein [Fimbriimonadaceae bacterium]
MDDPRNGYDPDESVYADLSRANVSRMRGDYAQAIEICRAILRDHAQNVSTHMLLGDVHADQGQLEQAAQCYEVAVDLDPSNDAHRQKLDSVRRRLADMEAAAAAKSLGLPNTRPKVGLYIATLVAFILLSSGLAYVLGVRGTLIGGPPEVVEDIVLETPKAPTEEPSPTVASPPTPVSTDAEEDRAILGALANRAADGRLVTEANVDPRFGTLGLTVSTPEGESPRLVAARLGVQALETLPDIRVVTVRCLEAGRIVFIADVRREDVMRTAGDEWRAQYENDPEAWVSAVLSNVWTPQPTEAAGS